jgi:hypothetical protein
MRRNWLAKAVMFMVFAPLFVVIFGFVTMWLWNWLMPALFGLHAIRFWQAMGLVLLSKILFGGFQGRAGRRLGGHWRGRMRGRWEKMTPEEREKFRQSMRNWCGAFDSPSAENKA